MWDKIRAVSPKLNVYLIPSPSFSLKMSGTLSASLCTYSYEKSAKNIYIYRTEAFSGGPLLWKSCRDAFFYLFHPETGHILRRRRHWQASPPRWTLWCWQFPQRPTSPHFHRTSFGRWSAVRENQMIDVTTLQRAKRSKETVAKRPFKRTQLRTWRAIPHACIASLTLQLWKGRLQIPYSVFVV